MRRASVVLVRAAAAALLLLICTPTGLLADIYRYRDENGVWHFTNVPQGGRYRLYMRTSRQPAESYIKEYDTLIRQASKQFGVEPSLIKAVIKAESDFNHRAVSVKGAQGLMQLMPGTASDMEVEDAFDPESNILGGTRYLSLLLKRFSNDTSLALAAYNAGPERVTSSNGIPAIQETRDFVKKVLGYYTVYSAGAE
jgi:soluble lytic murein transglycosylase-like protein